MNSKFKDIDIKNSTYFLGDMINIKNLGLKKSRQMKSHAKIFLFITLGTCRSKNNGVNSLYLITDKINGYMEKKQRKQRK